MIHANTLDTSSIASARVAARTSHRRLRQVGAVLAGLFAIFAVTTLTDVVMHAVGLFRPVGSAPMSGGLFLLAFAYRAVYDVAGSYLTARLAPDHPLRHALVLGSIGLVLSVVGAVVMWDAGPAWYSLGIAASAIPCAWLGGGLYRRR
jgi:hypothetical protein